MRRLLVTSLLLVAACQPRSAPTSTTPRDDPWCARGEHADTTLPVMQSYAGTLPASPQKEDAVVVVVPSASKPDQLWAFFVEGGAVVAWQEVPRQAYPTFVASLSVSTWGLRWVPHVGVNPPPPPDDGTRWGLFVREVARLEGMTVQRATERANEVQPPSPDPLTSSR